jgi:predicted kinase
MSKLSLNRPALILLYGYPGAGKSYLARQLCDDVQAAHVQSDRIRYELFEQPRYDQQENEIVDHLMQYMTEEFLNAGMGISVIYDINAMRFSQRRELRDMARKHKIETVLVWLQIDQESAFARVSKRDRRKLDDKYSPSVDRSTFDKLAGFMQNPQPTEDYMVISGKHTYHTQRNAILKKLYDMGLSSPDSNNPRVVKPGLVNLVPNPLGGRVDSTRRNINIR